MVTIYYYLYANSNGCFILLLQIKLLDRQKCMYIRNSNLVVCIYPQMELPLRLIVTSTRIVFHGSRPGEGLSVIYVSFQTTWQPDSQSDFSSLCLYLARNILLYDRLAKVHYIDALEDCALRPDTVEEHFNQRICTPELTAMLTQIEWKDTSMCVYLYICKYWCMYCIYVYISRAMYLL